MKKELYTIFIFLLISTTMVAQKGHKKEIRKLSREARVSLEQEDFLTSWLLSKKILVLSSQNFNAGTTAAVSATHLNYATDSLLFLKENLEKSPENDAKFFLAMIYHKEKKFDEALTILQEYENTSTLNRTYSNKEIDHLKSMCSNAKTFIAKPRPSVITNMGAGINSAYADYVPVLTPDESALYFTSKRPGENAERNGDNNFYEDVYVSYKDQDNSWKKAKALGSPINSNTNDGCVSLSPDGERMIVYRTAANVETGDLYISQLGADNIWGSLELMSSQINSPFIETSACFSRDSTEIYFSSNRPGGFGGKDLYRIKRLPNGAWSAAYNLGELVNTPYDEDAPFLHKDGVTFYFSSKGHNSMGGYDVFKTVLNKESNEFSLPENIGYPINDTGDDIFFVLSVDGKKAYYSSVKAETFGGIDIYEIDTRFEENDLALKIGYALIDSKPARVRISLTEKDSQQPAGEYYSNAETGKFIFILHPYKTYSALVEADGCLPLKVDIKAQATEKTNTNLEFVLHKNNGQ